MRIALKQSNLDKANEFLLDVSSPESPNFGKHWSAKQVAETFAPSEESVSMVVGWLAEFGISIDRVRQSQSLNWIYANVTVAEAEEMLKTKFYEFQHATSGQIHIACEEYSLPKDVQEHVDFVTPTVHFDVKVENPKQRRDFDQDEGSIVNRESHTVKAETGHSIGLPGDKSLPKDGGKVPFGTILDQLEHCDTSIVPNCLRALYEFPPYFPANPRSKNNEFLTDNTFTNHHQTPMELLSTHHKPTFRLI